MQRALCIKMHSAVFSIIVKKKTRKKVKCGREVQEGGDICIPVADSC